MTNEVHREVIYLGVIENSPFLFLRNPVPEIIKFALTFAVIFILGRLYYPSRVELQLLKKIKRSPVHKLPATLRSLVQDRSMLLAFVALVVRWTFWNVGVGKEERYASFPSPVIYRVPRPLSPRLCFNGAYQERRRFTLMEAELCARTWKARNGLTAVQYVPVVYSPKLQRFSCLSPSSMVAYGSIRIDNGTARGTEDAYVHDMHSLRHGCELNGHNCSGIESVRTHNNGTTWMVISDPIRGRLVVFILLRRLGNASLGEGYFSWLNGKSAEHILKVMLSIHLELSRATCYDTAREVPVGEKSAHLYIDLQILFCLVLLEIVLSRLEVMHGKRAAENGVLSHFSEVVVELLSGEDEHELEAA